jgi:polyisoprenoid-binding protein YceI
MRLPFRVRSAMGFTLALCVLLPMLPAAATAQGWSVDPNHSQVSFVVSHFATPVRGTFDQYSVDLTYDPDNPAASALSVEIPVASVNTSNQRRDNHLRSPDWFEAEKFPTITFKSTSVELLDESHLRVHGVLTIKDSSREVTLDVQGLGMREIPAEMQGAFGRRVASFRATTTIRRNDYGVGVGSWAGTAVVGDQVQIEILVEAHQK